ncbi:MAG: Kazal-type serine protease inhibitor [Bradymonadaceae bacterium]
MAHCKRQPLLCSNVEDPVCGCDDKTYRNECAAYAAGTSVRSDSACNANSPDSRPLPDDDSIPSRGDGKTRGSSH